MGGVGDFIQDEVIDPIKTVGSELDDFVNEEIPGGWLTVGAATGAGLLGSGALGGAAAAGEGAALGSGISAGAGGATGLTAGAGGVTGITAGTGASLGGIGTGLAAGGAVAGLDGALGSGLSSTATGQGLVAPSVPSLSSMGGGTGLVTEAAGGGLLSAGGVTAAGAVPAIGSAGSFINNPAILGTDVIGAQQGGIGLKQAIDALRAGNSIRGMLGRPEPQIPNMLGRNQMPQGSVDYSQYLNLLAQRPRRADITTLLG